MQIPTTFSHGTPYGTTATVHLIPGRDPHDDTAWAYDLDSTANMAGIWDQDGRRRLKEAAEKGQLLSPDDFLRFGGQKVPHEPLPVAASFFYDTLPTTTGDGLTTDDDVSMRDAADGWATAVADEEEWAGKAAVLLETLERQRQAFPDAPESARGIALGTCLTVVLESLGETEIDCLEQAGMYLLSHHPEWRAAARRWLMPVKTTWWADWIAARPNYRRLAKAVRHVHSDVPGWACMAVRG